MDKQPALKYNCHGKESGEPQLMQNKESQTRNQQKHQCDIIERFGNQYLSKRCIITDKETSYVVDSMLGKVSVCIQLNENVESQ